MNILENATSLEKTLVEATNGMQGIMSRNKEVLFTVLENIDINIVNDVKKLIKDILFMDIKDESGVRISFDHFFHNYEKERIEIFNVLKEKGYLSDESLDKLIEDVIIENFGNEKEYIGVDNFLGTDDEDFLGDGGVIPFEDNYSYNSLDIINNNFGESNVFNEEGRKSLSKKIRHILINNS